MKRIGRGAIWRLLGLSPEYLPLAVSLTMGAALVAGYLGQLALDRLATSPWAWVPLLAGAAIFASLAAGQALEQPRPGSSATVAAPRLRLLAPALLLAALAFPGFAGNRFRALPTLAWLGGLALLYLSFRSPSPARPAQDARRSHRDLSLGIRLSWHALALGAIVLVGAVLRLRELDAIPREMGVDMPLIYENAREIMQGQFMIFCPRYPGRESLYHYLLAAHGALFGLSFFSIKLVSVLVGLATIPALYGLASCLYDRQVALVAAGFLAVSKWHVILSRSGYRAVTMPLAVVLVLLTTVRALRRGRGTDFALAGIAVGLGMYTYNAFFVVPPTLAAALVIEIGLQGWQSWRRYRWGLVALALAALVVFLPLGHYALEHPRTYLFRVASRVTSVEAPLPGDLVGVFASNLWRAAGMFNRRGDPVFYINVPHQRELGAISGSLFIFGLACALWRWRRGHNAMLLVVLGGLILPTALAVAFPHEVPTAVRASGTLAPVYLLVAPPLVFLARRLAALWPGGEHRLVAFIALPPGLRWGWRGRVALNASVLAVIGQVALLGIEFGETWRAYFRDYVRHLPGRNYAISLEMARVLDEFEPEGQSYVKVWPHWFDGNALRAQLKVKSRSWDWELAELDPAQPPLATVQGRVLFIVHPDDGETLRLLHASFPRGVAIRHYDYNGRVSFVTFYGER